MRTLRRSLRNVRRNAVRSSALVAVLAVCSGLALTMLTVAGAFDRRLDEVKQNVGTEITVFPLGFFVINGPSDAADPEEEAPDVSLTAEDIAAIAAIEHITGITRELGTAYTGDELVSGIDEDDLPGNIRVFNPGGAVEDGEEGVPTGGFSFPISIRGIESGAAIAPDNFSDFAITAGRGFAAGDESSPVAVMGQQLAEANGLAVGDTFALDGTEITLIGIYTTGAAFGDNTVVLPAPVFEQVFPDASDVRNLTVQVDDVDNVEGVADGIRELLAEKSVQVITETSTYEPVRQSLTQARSSSEVALWVSLVASGAVIILALLLVARQRVKEIGILKAVGASNWNVTAQFGIETLTVAFAAAIIGAAATFPIAQAVADGLVSEPAAADPATNVPGPAGRAGAIFQAAPGGPGGTAAESASSLLGEIEVAVSPEIFLYAIGLALVLAIVASTGPAWYVSRVRPAEVLRYE